MQKKSVQNFIIIDLFFVEDRWWSYKKKQLSMYMYEPRHSQRMPLYPIYGSHIHCTSPYTLNWNIYIFIHHRDGKRSLYNNNLTKICNLTITNNLWNTAVRTHMQSETRDTRVKINTWMVIIQSYITKRFSHCRLILPLKFRCGEPKWRLLDWNRTPAMTALDNFKKIYIHLWY